AGRKACLRSRWSYRLHMRKTDPASEVVSVIYQGPAILEWGEAADWHGAVESPARTLFAFSTENRPAIRRRPSRAGRRALGRRRRRTSVLGRVLAGPPMASMAERAYML